MRATPGQDPEGPWNDGTAACYPRRSGVHHLVEAQAARTPAAVAVAHGGAAVTYGQLEARANRLARHLGGLGVGPEVVVGVLVERGIDMVVALLGILKAGGAYLPLDPDHPTARLAAMLDDAGAPVLVTQQALAARLGRPGVTAVRLDADRGAVDASPGTPPAVPFDAGQLAYVIYTSGSTGRPKGVEVPHRAMVNFLTSMARRPGIAAGDVVVALTTISFDIAGLELYLPLTAGARVVVASRAVATDAGRLAALFDDAGATLVQATPATWRMLVDGGWRGRPGLKALCGGEALPPALAGQLLERGVELWNMYGPTETTVWSTVARVTTAEPPMSIGRPIANTTVHILDDGLRPVPAGDVGELWIGGDGLARGYRGRPDLTAERFVPDPSGAGSRLYRTGDLARSRPDGTIECLGRVDHQVKVRGFRIELGEIESVLEGHPAVRAAAVAAREDGAGGRRLLVAYVVLRGAGAQTQAQSQFSPRNYTSEGGLTRGEPSAGLGQELRRHLRERLPDYMVPGVVVALDALPLTANGKVDRNALPPPGGASLDPSCYVAPRTEAEATVAAAWAEVLGIEQVGAEDDFFALGGHSLLAVQVAARLRDRTGWSPALATFFDRPTVAELAAALAAGGHGAAGRAGAGAGAGLPPIPPLVAADRSRFIR
ncbi:MAG: non-ribosomal peptide synthetase [Actinobacteria bacterium]|nr:non-ribosomal peptide synthetase [Actinomycetota bacterium]